MGSWFSRKASEEVLETWDAEEWNIVSSRKHAQGQFSSLGEVQHYYVTLNRLCGGVGANVLDCVWLERV